MLSSNICWTILNWLGIYSVLRTRITNLDDSIFKHDNPHEKLRHYVLKHGKARLGSFVCRRYLSGLETFSVLVFHDVHWGVSDKICKSGLMTIVCHAYLNLEGTVAFRSFDVRIEYHKIDCILSYTGLEFQGRSPHHTMKLRSHLLVSLSRHNYLP